MRRVVVYCCKKTEAKSKEILKFANFKIDLRASVCFGFSRYKIMALHLPEVQADVAHDFRINFSRFRHENQMNKLINDTLSLYNFEIR